MELIREHFRAIIFHNFRRGLSRHECNDELQFLYGDEASSYSSMKNWFNQSMPTFAQRRNPLRSS